MSPATSRPKPTTPNNNRQQLITPTTGKARATSDTRLLQTWQRRVPSAKWSGERPVMMVRPVIPSCSWRQGGNQVDGYGTTQILLLTVTWRPFPRSGKGLLTLTEGAQRALSLAPPFASPPPPDTPNRFSRPPKHASGCATPNLHALEETRRKDANRLLRIRAVGNRDTVGTDPLLQRHRLQVAVGRLGQIPVWALGTLEQTEG